MRYAQIRKLPQFEANQKTRLIQWGKETSITRVDKPLNISRARALGYKAKQGFVVVRVKIKKGTSKTPKTAGGRRPKRAGRFQHLDKSKQQVAEERASRKYKNMEVLNSYHVGETGTHKFFEVILIDKAHPAVKKDKERNWITKSQHTRRVHRGLTSTGKKSRGLRKK